MATLLGAYGFKSDAEGLAYNGNPIDILEPLAHAKVPLLHVCGDTDTAVPYEENSAILKSRYEAMGGPVEVILKKRGGARNLRAREPDSDSELHPAACRLSEVSVPHPVGRKAIPGNRQLEKLP